MAGRKLKSKIGWKLDEGKNYDNSESGFTALPGVCRLFSIGLFSDVGESGYWWSSTEYNSSGALFRNLS